MLENARPEVEKGWPKVVQRLMKNCWAADPRKRPSAQEIVRALGKSHPRGACAQRHSFRRLNLGRTRGLRLDTAAKCQAQTHYGELLLYDPKNGHKDDDDPQELHMVFPAGHRELKDGYR